MDLGQRRLVARSAFATASTPSRGSNGLWRGKDGRNARAFVVVPMRILPTDNASLLANDEELDRGNRDTMFRGVYYQFPALKSRDRFEVYWAGLDQGNRPNNDALPRDLDSVGFRAWRPTTAGTVELRGRSRAAARQVERDGGGRHSSRPRARRRVLPLGDSATRSRASCRPCYCCNTTARAAIAIRSTTATRATTRCYGERRSDFAPQGIYGLFVRGNLRTPGLRLTFVPWQHWQAMFSYRSYAARLGARCMVRHRPARSHRPGRAVRSAGSSKAASRGTRSPNRLTFETGFAQLWAGRFFRETAGAGFRGDPTFVYVTITTNFGGRARDR